MPFDSANWPVAGESTFWPSTSAPRGDEALGGLLLLRRVEPRVRPDEPDRRARVRRLRAERERVRVADHLGDRERDDVADLAVLRRRSRRHARRGRPCPRRRRSTRRGSWPCRSRSPARRGHARGRGRHHRVQVQFGDKHRVVLRCAALVDDGWHNAADDPNVAPPDVTVAVCPGTMYGSVAVSNVSGIRSRTSASRSTSPSRRRSRPRARRLSSVRSRRRSARRATARVSPDGANRVPISNRPTSLRPCRRLCATTSTSPGSSIGRSVSNFRRQRVGDRARAARRPAANERRGPGFDESKRHGFREPCRRQNAAQRWSRAMRGSGGGGGCVRDGNVDVEPIEAVVPSDFFDEIDLARQVDAEGRRDDVPSVGGGCRQSAESVEDAHDVGVRHRLRRAGLRAARDAGAASSPGAAPDSGRRSGRRHLAGADGLHQRNRALHGGQRAVDVGAALEARRRFGFEAELLARPAHRRGLEVRALEDDRLVAADTSDVAPPMTPATACARSRSAMTSMSSIELASTPSSVVIVSPFFARRTWISAPASFARSNACIGWPRSIST